jgi:hypothetical protein
MYCKVPFCKHIFVPHTSNSFKLLIIKSETMKNRIPLTKTLVMAYFLAICGTAMATDPAPRNTATATEQTIRDYFRFPSFVTPLPVNSEEKVEVLFTTDANGKVNFVMARTSNRELKQLVEQKLTGISLRQLQANVVHSVVLSFRKA